MALSLQKGGNLSLSKEAPGLTKILVGLGWDPRSTDGTQFDLDASAFLLNATGKVRGDADFIFYNQLKSPDGSVEHTGDNRDGAGDDAQGIEPVAKAITALAFDREPARRLRAGPDHMEHAVQRHARMHVAMVAIWRFDDGFQRRASIGVAACL